MTREEKVAEAQQLRSEGLLLREIAERMGVALTTAGGWLSDPDLSKQRARRQSYRGACAECGKPTDGSNGRVGAPDRCRRCIEVAFELRRQRIFAAWERGDTGKVIAAREGVTETAVLGLVEKWRRLHGVPITRHKRSHRELWPLIERRWHEGATAREIAAETDTNEGNISFMIQAMRRAGVDLPYRYHRAAA